MKLFIYIYKEVNKDIAQIWRLDFWSGIKEYFIETIIMFGNFLYSFFLLILHLISRIFFIPPINYIINFFIVLILFIIRGKKRNKKWANRLRKIAENRDLKK